MITINNIEGSPEFIPETYKQQHFDGDYFYFFETDEEVALFKSCVKPKIINNVITETATPQDILDADPKNSAQYYLIREEAGKELVRLVSDMLLKDINSGVRTFVDTMIIEEKLEKTMASLNMGQLLTGKYKMSLTQGTIPNDLFSFIFTSIDNLCKVHYT